MTQWRSTRSRPGIAMTVLAILTAVAAAATGTAQAAQSAVASPASLVDPFIGTGSGGEHVGNVDAFPGASVPFGMVQFSPDTPNRPAGGGYAYEDNSITGFSLTHLSGVGCPIGGDIPFLPTVGAVPADPDHASEPFSHSAEHAAPGSYGVTLGNSVGVELGTTARTGLATFTYPATNQAQLLVKVSGSEGAPSNATFHTVGNTEIAGSVTNGHFCGQPDSYTLYFDASFTRPFSTSGTWGGAAGAAVRPGSTAVTATGHPHVAHGKPGEQPASARTTSAAAAAPGSAVGGGYLTFDTRAQRTVRMQVGVSYVSEAGARSNRLAEETSLTGARQTAAKAWDDQLGKIATTGGSTSERTSFYTALYHASLHPSLFSDADGRYLGFHNQVHTLPAGHNQYADFSGWDIYRSQIPLLALIDPAETSDMIASLLRDGDQMGFLPKWPVANGESGVMNGDAADPIIAGAYAFGARGFDAQHAIDEMVHGAEASGPKAQGWYVERPSGSVYIDKGYIPNTQATSISPVPNGASETQEYAIADLAIAQLAADAGRTDVAARFGDRAQNWAHLFNTSTGYIQPRDADGAFPSGDPLLITNGFGQSGFQEGNTAQYTWMVPENIPALIQGIGGGAAAQARLDDYFSQLNAGPNQPYHWQGNEPTFGTPWIYNSAGAPWKTQATVRRIQSALYQPIPGGEPGNDDLGAMSSWYVWASLGVYPQVPGTALLSVNSPLFSHAVINGGAGRQVVINAPGAGDNAPYVDGLTVNGTPTTHTWLTLPATGTTTLNFGLDTQPNHTWGTGPNDGTPAFATGPVQFPPSTRASLRTDPSAMQLTGGQSKDASLIVDNSLGNHAASVTWTATPTAGISVSPDSGTIDAAAAATSSTVLTVSAPADVKDGLYDVAVTGHDSNGAVLPTAHLRITVGHPAQAYVSNYSDNTVTPVDTVSDTAGVPIPVGSGPDGVVVLPDNQEVYVANNNTNDVTVISAADNHVVTTIPVGSVAADVIASADSSTVWVSNYGDGTIQPIDTATHTAGTPIPVGPNPQRLRFSPDGSQIWVPDQGNGTVAVVDVATRTVVHSIPVGPAPFGVAFGQNKAYVSNTGNGTLSVIDTGTYSVVGTLDVPAPNGLANTGDLSLVYASLNGGGVQPINTDKDLLGTPITFGSGTYAVRFTDDGSTAWAVDSNTNDIQEIGVASGTTGATVPVGNVPDGIGLTH